MFYSTSLWLKGRESFDQRPAARPNPEPWATPRARAFAIGQQVRTRHDRQPHVGVKSIGKSAQLLKLNRSDTLGFLKPYDNRLRNLETSGDIARAQTAGPAHLSEPSTLGVPRPSDGRRPYAELFDVAAVIGLSPTSRLRAVVAGVHCHGDDHDRTV
jgi:hypothetical protein